MLRRCACMLALVIWKANRIFSALYCVVMCGLSGCTTFWHIISLTAQFPLKTLLSINCMFWFPLPLLSETFLIARRVTRGFFTNAHRCSCKVSVIIVSFIQTWIFSKDSPKILKVNEIFPGGAEFSMRTDRRDEGYSCFCQFGDRT